MNEHRVALPALKPRFDFKAILHEAKVNQTNLRGCPGPHDFHPEDPAAVGFGAKYRCTRCEGVVDSHAHYWYRIGQDHGTPAVIQIKESQA